LLCGESDAPGSQPPNLMISFMIMKTAKITRGGQISIPSGIRRRWGTSTLALEDLGDHIVLRPASDDPVAAARGALATELTMNSRQLRSAARNAESTAEQRRHAAK
jgi:AbrB family looped-hinge helix DNA binding protein